MKRSRINPVSPKRAAAMVERRAFNKTLPRDCQIKSKVCWGAASSWHEAIKRSHSGAIVPGEKATAQGQVFWASCSPCQTFIEDNPRWGVEHGFVKRSKQ